MIYFPLVKQILDVEYPRLPFPTDDEKDQAVINALACLTASYEDLYKGCLVDYSKPETRFAYIFRYFTVRAKMAYTYLGHSRRMWEAISNKKGIRLLCLGGGPGTEILGLIDIISSERKDIQIDATIIDKEAHWIDLSSTIFKLQNCGIVPKINYHITDIRKFQPKDIRFIPDIVTISYIGSEICYQPENGIDIIGSLINSFPVDTLWYDFDNKDDKQIEWIKKIIQDNNCELLKEDDILYGLSSSEEKKDLGRYFEKYGCPQIEARKYFNCFKRKS